jgi:hypothetical protein
VTRRDGDSADGTSDDASADERPDAHLRDLADGCGCAEVWEHLSEARDGTADGDEGGAGD